ncbi:CIA30 family protein [Aspergillus eucalypticola CBS 122712]|uniref:CIA30 family protein n=1 Tax=Aspergillus eucalypticola (strain CBS 122712 / IBT 29274) TaxID=1448314 RepID=A0A317VL35_ASPEC|nr:CIA30 family protein [Aspergillus eucalypticola CBS 122712]PWY72630.1 CIA30 family protein [Aspergillus eucalypticola CBS 122712]
MCTKRPSGPFFFGGPQRWSSVDWTSSDDRVRGGSSQSYLSINDDTNTATFHGNLDIKTLGGAGFASQHTASTTELWDLSSYAGLELSVPKSDGHTYTLNLRDELQDPRPDGRQRSGLVWEAKFKVEKGQTNVKLGWREFRPTYRGREVHMGRPLILAGVKQFGIMIRSFFGEQEGDFELEIEWIRGIKKEKERYRDDPNDSEYDGEYYDEKHFSDDQESRGLGWLCCW